MAKPTRYFAQFDSLHIQQVDMSDSARPMTSHAPMPALTRPPRRPLSASSSNVILNPPMSGFSAYTPPYKTKSSPPRSPLKSAQHARLNAATVSMAPPLVKSHSTDDLRKKPQLSKFKTGGLHKPTFALNFGKENIHPHVLSAPPPPINMMCMQNYFDNPTITTATTTKRPLMDAAPIRDSRAKKIKIDDASLPPHDSFPPISDDGSKPSHSYAQLIGMAILRSPLRRLTLAQIYKWISDNYSFYNANDAGWQNSIRHNLSLHKNFIKIERPRDDPGKGNYWAIEPGTEHQFLKEKPPRKSAPSAENLPVMSTRLEPSTARPNNPPPPLAPSSLEPTLPMPMPSTHSTRHSALPPLQTCQSTNTTTTTTTMATTPADMSSDATIPVSDSAAPDDHTDRHPDNELPPDSSLYSPLPTTMHSSPPMPTKRRRQETGTPPPPTTTTHSNSSAGSRSRKRAKFTSMDDSGYISSLESSVMRPNQKAILLTSEADRPRIKRGRAEEEIARLRASSPFSPTKSRSFPGYGPTSSSPLRPTYESQPLLPLTPVVKMNPPVRPPPSVSPNTNLRIHRDKVRHMLQSPLRRISGVSLSDEVLLPWSPAFRLDENLSTFDDFSTNTATDFDIFQDIVGIDDTPAFPVIGSADSGSPIKRSAKQRNRSVSSSAVDLMNSTKKPTASVPLLRVPEHSPLRIIGIPETPSKAFEGLSSPVKMTHQSPTRLSSSTKFSAAAMLQVSTDDVWSSLTMDPSDFASSSSSSSNQDKSDFGGLDILQGFQKIGSSSQPNLPSSSSRRPSKPSLLGRSYSTTF